MFAIRFCVFLYMTIPSEGNANALKYKKQWAGCSSEEPFLILINIVMDKCVSECNIRKACLAVNYWTRRLQCDMFFNDTESPLQDGNNTQPCVFVKKADFDPAYEKSLENCTGCNGTTACDISSGQCEIRECRQLLVPNATIKGNILSVGSKIRIYCNSSFAQHPNETLSICQANGNWSNVPTCQYLFACAEPPTFANATMIMGTRAVGDVIHYTCTAGFSDPHADLTVVGNNNSKTSIQCQENGTWTYSDFQCVADCDEPPIVVNATVTPGAIMHGSERNYTCNEGYTDINNATMIITCIQDGMWTDVAFECVQDCDEPPDVENATITSGAIVQGSVRSYTCNDSYSNINNASMNVTCQQDGTWTVVAFECMQDCVSPHIVSNAAVSPGATLQGSVRRYTCNDGYSNINNAPMTVTCQQNSTWTAVVFECVQDCDNPPGVDNATVSPGATMQGSKRSYTCSDGYSEINNAPMTLTCQQGGTWTAVAFECVQDCIAPPSVDNATVSTGAIVQGSERSYTCNEGYIEINNAPMTVTCLQGGTWTTVAFDCARTCPEPASVENTSLSTGDNLEGAVRNYTCIPDHMAINVSTMSIVCQDGSWTPALFKCVPNNVCPSDMLSIHQSFLPDGTVIRFRAFNLNRGFYEARDLCAAESGRLYQILSLVKMNLTIQIMNCPAYQSDFWIDGVQNDDTDVWETMDGTPLPMSNDYWASQRPNGSPPNNCLYMGKIFDYKWDDKKCSFNDQKTVIAICEFSE